MSGSDPRGELAPPALEALLHARIPLSSAMGIRVRAAGPREVRLTAPLAPNINTTCRGTDLGEMVFGGSVVAVAILAAWTLLYVRDQTTGDQTAGDQTAGGGARLLIQRSAMQYERPITGDFEAVCALEDETAYARFRRTLGRHGRARLTLHCTVLQNGARAASFEGDFVALRSA